MRNNGLLWIIAFLSISFQGCVGATSDILRGEDEIEVPEWHVGDWWIYTFTTPDFFDDSARLVVATVDEEEGGTAYMLGISSEEEARRHAVLNHNPFLGRITHSNLGVFENGVEQAVLSFPLSEKSWTFTLFEMDWTASAEVEGEKAYVKATSTDGSKITYTYDHDVRFITSFVRTDPGGTELLRISLSQSGSGYQGDVHFMRGRDLLDKEYENNGPNGDVEDSFLVQDHPNDGSWDEMIYLISASSGSGGSSISLTLRDHTSASVLERFWGPGASESGTLGTIPSPSGEYTLTASFTGQTELDVMIAGGIGFSWSI